MTDNKNDNWFEDLNDDKDEMGEFDNNNFLNSNKENVDSYSQAEILESDTMNGDINNKITRSDNNYYSSVFKYLLFAVSLGSLLGVLYIYLFTDSNNNQQVLDITQSQPLKQEPIDPQGMEIKNLDKEVYNILNDGKQEQKVERLLPIPEKPIISKSQVEVAKTVQPKKIENKKYEVRVEKLKKETLAKPEQVKKTRFKKQVSPIKTSSWKVQVASVSSQTQAKTTYKKLVKKYSLPAKYQLHIEKVIIKGKNYHRVQLKGFSNKAKAFNACNIIKSKGGNCLVKR
jgi:cell division septation protein DedD